eukprot:CAMPEP_0181313104 /NCGR_PEP_ID=MMETSP1101-20121128/14068_1 /TAXON_ID=46948 /ORGANISM="Rhodomonas abbreviata, Strain Caron Lab Isolate" /LENGTH=296 /DNA_ID=CAMNT_0023420031 /DNA_START=426 /DNA_END=1316 /DNA_ORIENTATION=-
MTEKQPLPYVVTPITPHFGGEVRGFDLKGTAPLSPAVVNQLKEDMKQYRVLVFKGQGQISGERQVQISQQLGEIESTFYKHPRSPHPDIFRVSNDEGEGCTGVGRTGWHVDGTFQQKPFKYQTMHFHSVAEGGDTWFVPLKELYELQDEETKSRWERLWMLTGRGGFTHPLVYTHPVRRDTTLLLHCGRPFCSGWALDDDNVSTKQRRIARLLPAHEIQDELTAKLDAAVDTIGIKMRWEEGDFAINDNLGNAHYATPGTQGSRAAVGLRVLHRTTVAGEEVPEKEDGRRSFVLRE